MTILSSYGAAQVDMTASAQALALIVAAYWDRQDAAQALIGADGSILLYQFRPQSWPPSLLLLKQPGPVYTIAMTGTTNIAQFGGHINGTFGRSYLGQTLVNGQWAGAWDMVWAEVRPLITEPLSTVTIRLTGHSYGGAVATLGGLTLAQMDAPPKVQIMAYGAPQAVQAGYQGPVPDAWGWWSYQDPVPGLPSGNTIVAIARTWGVPTSWFPEHFGWQHYGEQLPLGPDGTVGLGGATPDPLPPGVSVGPTVEHSTVNYRGRLQAWWQSHGQEPVMGAALAITAGVQAGTFPQQITPGLPLSVPGPDGQPILIPLYGGIDLTDPYPGVPRMAWPTALSGGTPYVLVRYINWGAQGWTERQLVYITGSEASRPGQAILAASLLNTARLKLLSENCAIVGTRVGIDGQPQTATLYTSPPLSTGAGKRTGISAPPNVSWVLRTVDATGTVKGSPEVRGLVAADASLTSGNSDRNFQFTPPQLLQYKNDISNILLGQNGVPAFGGFGAFRTIQRDPAVNPFVPVMVWGLDANGYLQVTVPTALQWPNTPPATGFRAVANGDRLAIKLTRSKCTARISGTYPVINVGAVSGSVVYTLRKKPCCPPSSLGGLVGGVRPVYPIYVYLAAVSVRWMSTRDTGPAFFSGAGRGSSRCC